MRYSIRKEINGQIREIDIFSDGNDFEASTLSNTGHKMLMIGAGNSPEAALEDLEEAVISIERDRGDAVREWAELNEKM